MGRPAKLDVPFVTHLYWSEQKTIAEIAAILQIGKDALEKRMRKYGIPTRSTSEAKILSSKRRGKPGHLDRQFLLREYVERGRTTADIARDLGVHRGTVEYHMKKVGVPLRSCSERMVKVWSDEVLRGQRIGENAPNWKGGRRMCQGYFMIRKPAHPDADTQGYVFIHRLVMERMIGRRLRPGECVHHRNNVRTDNRPENLQLFSNNSEHIRHHALERRLRRLAGFAALQSFEAWLNRSCA